MRQVSAEEFVVLSHQDELKGLDLSFKNLTWITQIPNRQISLSSNRYIGIVSTLGATSR